MTSLEFDVGQELPTRSSVDDAYDRILGRIVEGKFLPGDILVCARLAKLLHISRTPVATALDRLVSDGILEKEKHHRARVRLGAENWLLHIHQLRELVEPPAAALAAKHISEEALATLQKLADASTPNSHRNWAETAREFDFALHLAIAEHSQNLPLRELINRCWRFKVLSYDLGCRNPEIEEIGHREHLAILFALAEHDSETASVAMLYHLRSSLCLSKSRQVV